MFTGLVLDVGEVLEVERGEEGLRFVVETGLDPLRLSLGASVACNGVCLTVTKEPREGVLGRRNVEFFVGPVTLQKSGFGGLAKGMHLNLEPALRSGDPLGGHQVQGHVDGMAEVAAFVPRGESWLLSLKLPREWLKWVIPQGSIAIKGVSLTVAGIDLAEALVTIMLIPHSLSVTNLADLKPGHEVEVECDMQTKALAHMAEALLPALVARALEEQGVSASPGAEGSSRSLD